MKELKQLGTSIDGYASISMDDIEEKEESPTRIRIDE